VRFHHFALEVSDLEESAAFYRKHFDIEIETSLSLNEEELVFLATRDFRLELISNRESKPHNQSAHICFEVTNLHETMKRLSDCPKIEGPYTLSNGWQTVFYEGPDGEILEFLQVIPV